MNFKFPQKNKTLIYLGVMLLAYQVLLFLTLKRVDSAYNILAHQISTSEIDLLNYFQNMNSHQIFLYQLHYVLDGIYLLLYSLLLAAFIQKFLATNTKWTLIPLLAGLFDQTENLIYYSLAQDFSLINKTTALLAGLSSILKWFFVGWAYLIILWGLIKKKGNKV